MGDLSLSACVAEIKANPGKFYVYVLCRPDGTPFYVGCGKVQQRGWQRVTFHEREARGNSVLSHKCNTIRLIWNSGGSVGYKIDSWHGSEAEMFAREIELISALGRADRGIGPLTNWSDGGDGLINRSEDVRRRASETMRARMDPEWGLRSARRIKAHWDSEEGRAKRLAANFSPEAQAARSATLRRLGADPAFKKKKSAAMLAMWATAEYQEKQNAALRAAVSTPEHRAKKGAESKARWSDPEYRERLRASHRARWQLKKSK